MNPELNQIFKYTVKIVISPILLAFIIHFASGGFR
jgi:hypothetical protein